MIRQHLKSTLFPYTTLFRSDAQHQRTAERELNPAGVRDLSGHLVGDHDRTQRIDAGRNHLRDVPKDRDRKSTRLNSSHVKISYAVFCLKKKKRDEKLITNDA